ncbi:MAG: GFA family protein [Burkholderiaceae bacterium]|nr:GFA family protein [Burkholderiaceae bacterium]
MESRTLTGSCLCGGVRFTIRGTPTRFYHCHCTRCRKATGTGHASNLFVEGRLHWDSGEALIRQFKVPEAERFTNCFCSECGARLPRVSSQNGLIVVPAGSLDVDPGMAPEARIFMGSRAGWSCGGQTGPLPEFGEYAG